MSDPVFSGIHAEILQDTTAEIDVEGARFSGKTWLCGSKVIRSGRDFPGIEWLANRYNGEDTKNTLRPELARLFRLHGIEADWHADENAFWFPTQGGLTSKIFAFGLKSQTQLAELAKVRGLNVAGVWNDQSEELPQKISEELRFATRQPGFPHQLIFSPNPPPEDHYLCDQFPEDNPLPHRKYYRISLYENPHVPAGKIAELEAMYPPTHAKYKSLILGQRGVNVVGVPVYSGAFLRETHHRAAVWNPIEPILEAVQYGQHHPSWIAAQRTYDGGVRFLAAIMGKRMFLDEFLPLVKAYRAEWFPHAQFRTCCDPPPDVGSVRFTNINALKDAGFKPRWVATATSPDVREAVIQDLFGVMRRQGPSGFTLNDDPERFLMASQAIVKQHKFVLDGFESAYVWDDHLISVGSKKVRQPKGDEWTDGAQRCLENIWLNFCAGRLSQAVRQARKLANRQREWGPDADGDPNGRMSWAR